MSYASVVLSTESITCEVHRLEVYFEYFSNCYHELYIMVSLTVDPDTTVTTFVWSLETPDGYSLRFVSPKLRYQLVWRLAIFSGPWGRVSISHSTFVVGLTRKPKEAAMMWDGTAVKATWSLAATYPCSRGRWSSAELAVDWPMDVKVKKLIYCR